MQQISIEDFRRHWQSSKGRDACCLIDVRTPDEYAQGHVPGAQLICLDTLDECVSEISKDKDVYLICRSGARSASAFKHLRDAYGFTRLTNVTGGTMAWINAGYAVER